MSTQNAINRDPNRLLIELFYKWEKETPNDIFLRQPFGDKWEEYSWKQTGNMARKLAAYIQTLGLPPKSHIALVSKNCREWVISDIAIMMCGHVSVPMYPTLTADAAAQVVDLGDVKAVIAGKIENWEAMKNGFDESMPMIKFPQYKDAGKIERGKAWEEIMTQYDPINDNYVPDVDDLWTIVFTSGTTGVPKGVMHTYRMLQNVSKATVHLNKLQSVAGDNRFFSFLPLNHVAERLAIETQCLEWGGSISFSENLQTFSQNLRDTQPTMFFGVPRIYTIFQQGLLAKMPQKKLDLLLKIPIVSGMIKKKLQKGLGFDKSRVRLVGAAPMSIAAKKWWATIGLPISEGYGMTENLGVATFLAADEIRPGSIGKFYEGAIARIDPETNELCVKCPWNLTGYYKNKEKTDEALRDGWLHTGDQGRIDEEGFVYLTGRVKDMFKTAKGKFIIPSPMEWKFGHNSDIEQVVIAGLGLVQPMALVIPSEIGKSKSQEALKCSLEDSLNEANAEAPNYQKLSHIVAVKDNWSIDNGVLTPTLKVKRGRIDELYLDKMHNWCEQPDKVIFE